MTAHIIKEAEEKEAERANEGMNSRAKCGDVERTEQISNCKTNRKLAQILQQLC